MTTTSPITSGLITSGTAATANTALASQTAATRTLGNSNADLDRFLTLLTAQLRYQDPMSPTDPTQFVAQLAQFSQVEQQTKSNTLLTQISGAVAGNGLTQAAALIGKQVDATTSSIVVPASGNPAAMNVSITDSALRNTRVVVKDAAGTVLRTIPVNAGQTSVSFDGRGADGRRLPADTYAVSLVGDSLTAVGQSAGTIRAAGRVAEVRSQAGGGYRLMLEDGRAVDLEGVTRLAP